MLTRSESVPYSERVLREGVVAGLIGAATVAVWFLVLDFARGKPLWTPTLLGSAVLYGIDSPAGLEPALAPVLGYTLLHGLAFVAFGVIATSLVVLSEHEPPVFVAFLALFAAFEVCFVAVVAAFSRSLLGEIVWWSVLVANFLASATMLTYLFRLHPAYGDRSPFAPVWFVSTVGVAASLAVYGIVMYGWRAISWPSAAVWGVVGAAAFLVVAEPLWRATGNLDFLDLLGSVVAEPGTTRARVLGGIIHHVNGALLAVAWAYGTVIFNMRQSGTGLAWGLVLWALAITMVNTIGSVHPAVRRGERPDPVGSVPSLMILIPHLVYGVAIEALYRSWPLNR
jgi:hypothetical protein